MTSHLAALETQRDELNKMAQQLQRRIQTKEYVMSNEVTIKPSPAIVVAAHRTATTYSQIFADIPAGFGTVMHGLTQGGIDPAGIPFTLYYQAPDGDTEGDIAMCVPIASADPVDAEGVDIIEFEAGATACVVHKGSYEDMGESYATAATWIHERGHQIVGPHREVYLNSPGEVAEHELLTEIHFPIDADGSEA